MLSGALQGKGASLVGSFSVHLHFEDQRSMDIEDWRAAHTSDRSYLDNKSVAGQGTAREKSVLGEHEECQLKGAWRGAASSAHQTDRGMYYLVTWGPPPVLLTVL